MPEIIKTEHKILRPDTLPEQPVKPEMDPLVKKAEKPDQAEIVGGVVLKPTPADGLGSVKPTDLTSFEKKVENVLEEDLADVYLSLSPDKQQEFKKAGEIAAKKISRLMRKVKISLSQIIKIIRQWLSVIPGVNKYFLEQTAKIKADKILKLH
ncbi:hypothetical protein KKC17_03775 [Patescibacteria group bacterium]|nr:hypothetical protein [Patescibacteria group bacterium]